MGAWESGDTGGVGYLPPPPAMMVQLLVEECMGNVQHVWGVGARRQNYVVTVRVCFWPLTHWEPAALLPGLDFLWFSELKVCFYSARPADQFPRWSLRLRPCCRLKTNSNFLVCAGPRGEKLFSLKGGEMLTRCTKFDSCTALGCLGPIDPLRWSWQTFVVSSSLLQFLPFVGCFILLSSILTQSFSQDSSLDMLALVIGNLKFPCPAAAAMSFPMKVSLDLSESICVSGLHKPEENSCEVPECLLCSDQKVVKTWRLQAALLCL